MSGSGPIYEYQREVTERLEQALRERDEARAEVERLKESRDIAFWLHDEAKQMYWAEREISYRRGAEAMREAAASCVGSDTALLQTYRSVLEGRIRALPVPEDK